ALPYGTKTNPDDRHPGYQEYEVGQKGNYISPWFYEILMGYNPARFTGIVDPRIPYYIYNQLLPGDDTREGNPWEYRDGGFISIVFGSIGTNRDHSTDQSMTVLGLYPVGGRYDDGGAIAVKGTSATGDAPFRFITYADRLYIEAELMQAGVITGDARAKLEEAMYASFDLVDWVVNSTSTAQAVPALLGSGSDTTYIDAVLAEYDAEDAEGQMEIIMTEKWISSFGNSVDQYTDYRRTGYPVLFDPNNSTQAPNREIITPEGVIVPVRLNNPFQLSLPWSDDDLNINPNAPAQKKPGEYRVFWDVN
ncbi:MAG: SusD/RagB family nutrient-binding outer membrane lipoprotein, partial [Bacteroidales bacterium]|nr:SusD/RagB family nutrient-binding outer membrane lipoprotein [Bacteroidales bacterium]